MLIRTPQREAITNKKTPVKTGVDDCGGLVRPPLAPPVGLSQIANSQGKTDVQFSGGNAGGNGAVNVELFAQEIKQNLTRFEIERLIAILDCDN